MGKRIQIKSKKKVAMATFFFFIIVFYANNSHAQDSESRVVLTTGLSWRSTGMNVSKRKSTYLIRGIYRSYIYDNERTVQGFSLNIGLQYQLTGNLKIEYYPNLRYDHVKTNRYQVGTKYVSRAINTSDSILVKVYRYEKVKAFLIDHNFNFLFKGKKMDYGVGVTVIDRGRSITYTTYNAFVVVPIKKVINLEIKALYLSKGFFIFEQREKHVLFSLRAFYKFNLKKKT